MRRLASCFLLTALCATSVATAAEKPHVTLELLARPGMSLTTQQQWYKVLTDQGISGLRIHSPAAGDEMGIAARLSKSREYHVVGVLAADNMLYLPGAKFALNDVGKLRKWFDNLADAGSEGVTSPRSLRLHRPAIGASQRRPDQGGQLLDQGDGGRHRRQPHWPRIEISDRDRRAVAARIGQRDGE